MSSRTQIVCLHEGEKGRSIDPVFINALIKKLDPAWIRKDGSNTVRTIPGGGRTQVIEAMPGELKRCLIRGADTTLMVWADLDNDMQDGDQLKALFWKEAETARITKDEFDGVVFVFAKYRIENWIEFLITGKTDEEQKGPRVKHNREVADAARVLAVRCAGRQQDTELPPSLKWSCKNWRALVARMAH